MNADNVIRKGDLVMVVRGHQCTVDRHVGKPFIVARLIEPSGGGWRCPHCRMAFAGGNETGATWRTDTLGAIPLSWLLKINPPALDTGTEREMEPV